MSELKKCLKCGGEARLQRKQKTGHGYYVICKKCGCRTPLFQYQFDSKETLREDAIKTWNNRKLVEDVLERMEKKIQPIHNVNWNAAMEEAIEIIKEELM